MSSVPRQAQSETPWPAATATYQLAGAQDPSRGRFSGPGVVLEFPSLNAHTLTAGRIYGARPGGWGSVLLDSRVSQLGLCASRERRRSAGSQRAQLGQRTGLSPGASLSLRPELTLWEWPTRSITIASGLSQ